HEIDSKCIEALRHGVIVIVKPLLTSIGGHADVFFDAVVFANPLPRGLHARVVLVNAGINHALDAGVGHAGVAGFGGRGVGRVEHLGLTGTGSAVNEAAVVNLVGPRLVVGFTFPVLAAAYENHCFLVGFIRGWNAGGTECVERELRVGEIGAVLAVI